MDQSLTTQVNLGAEQTTTVGKPAPAQEVFAPGLRVEIRDAEWVSKRADLTSNGTHSVLVTGISELVRGREARFLTELDDIKPLHPEDTELAPDASSQFADTPLSLESLLRQSPPTGTDLRIGHRAAIDVLPYQLDPALQALKQNRVWVHVQGGKPEALGEDAWESLACKSLERLVRTWMAATVLEYFLDHDGNPAGEAAVTAMREPYDREFDINLGGARAHMLTNELYRGT